MRKLLFVACILFFLPLSLFSQIIDVNKLNGLVTVNGKKAFYMVPKNKVLWESDYAMENMERKQLAYFKLQKKIVYNSRLKSHDEVQYFVLSFERTGDHCEIKDFMDDTTTIVRSLAKKIITAGLISGNDIIEAKEKEFVTRHNGILAKDSSIQSGVTTVPIVISIKETSIYNNGQVVGSFKKLKMDDLLALQVYNGNQNRVAEVTHEEKNPNWTIVTPVDQEKFFVPFDADAPLETLFKYLVMKKYL